MVKFFMEKDPLNFRDVSGVARYDSFGDIGNAFVRPALLFLLLSSLFIHLLLIISHLLLVFFSMEYAIAQISHLP